MKKFLNFGLIFIFAIFLYIEADQSTKKNEISLSKIAKINNFKSLTSNKQFIKNELTDTTKIKEVALTGHIPFENEIEESSSSKEREECAIEETKENHILTNKKSGQTSIFVEAFITLRKSYSSLVCQRAAENYVLVVHIIIE